MIGNRTAQEILGLYDKNLFSLYSVHRISELLRKAYPFVYNKVKDMVSAGVIKSSTFGRSKLCSLNLHSDRAMLMMEILELQKTEALLKRKSISADIIDEIRRLSQEFTIHAVVHASGKMHFILEYINDKEAIKNRSDIIRRSGPLFFDKRGFCEQLLQQEELFSAKVVVHGSQKYYEMLRGVEPKLRVRYSPI